MQELLVVLSLGLLLLLPQLAGLIVMRFVPRAGWTAWPAAAIAVFGVGWHQWLWAPARDRALQAETGCGMWSVGCYFILVVGLVLHLGVGALFGAYVARRRSLRAPAVTPPQ